MRVFLVRLGGGERDLLLIQPCDFARMFRVQQRRIVRKRQPRLPLMRRAIDGQVLPRMQQSHALDLRHVFKCFSRVSSARTTGA